MAPTLQAIDAFIGRGNPIANEGGARMLLRATGGNLAGAAFLALLARKESEFGRTSGRFKGNAWGWGVHLGPEVNTSRSFEEGARKVWKGLNSGLYKGAGLTSTNAIINRYAPPSENNTGLYQQQVSQWGSQLGLNPGASVFGGPTANPGQAPGAPAGAAPQMGNRVDAQKLLSILQGQTKRSLQGQMPGPNFTKRISALAASAGSEVAAVATQAVGQPANPASAQFFRAAAQQQVGTPYSWGGGTPAGPTKGIGRGAGTTGFDCSGLTEFLWAKKGISIGPTTYQQIKTGRGINASNRNSWLPGDLLFPSTGHVQMYLGNGQVVEAPRTGGHVQIVPLRSSYIAVRRPG